MRRLLQLFPVMVSGIIFLSCTPKDNPTPTAEDLKMVNYFVLDIEDPSGLSKSPYENHFYTISDKSGFIYLINDYGEIINTIDVQGDDLEGIEYDATQGIIYVLEERLKWVLSLKPDGEILDTFQLSIPNIKPNDGPEGLAYNPSAQHFYVVNTKNPSRLYIYDQSFTLIEEHPLTFALDYSSVDYEPTGNHLWILSDESKLLARCNLQGTPDRIYNTGVPKGEGVVIDTAKKLIYIVCDQTSGFYVFELPEQ